MRAMRFHEFGDAGVLRLEEIDKPVAGPGEALVRVTATSFNPVDATLRAGYLQQAMPLTLPHIPGLDVAGVTEDGRPVIGFLPMTADGAAAEWVVAPAGILTPAPAGIPLADAAAVPAVALTAWQALFEHAGVTEGQRVLINGAGGGVGGYAVQFAHAAGAHVIATASPRSAPIVREQGADEIIDYTATPVSEAITEPVDVVLNLVRADDAAMAALVPLVRPGGVVVSTASPVPEDTDRKVRSISMYVRSDATQLATIVERIDAGEVRVDVSSRHALADLPEVHRAAAAGELRGKAIIVVRD